MNKRSVLWQRQPSRRAVLGGLGLGAFAVAAPSVLSGCSNPAAAPPDQGGEVSDEVLPKYIPIEYAEPDFPSVDGSMPGFASLPADPVRAVPEPPGSGKTWTAMVPVWGPAPPADGNQYYEAVNEVLGDTVQFLISDGNTYGDKLATVFASPDDVPDWVNVPDWNIPPRFGSEIVGNVFADLTPFLAGDAVAKYPNLANIPTDAWKMCVFNGKLYGLPLPTSVIRNIWYYRDDLLEEMGISADIRSADDLLNLAKELTDPSKQRWGAEDLLAGAMQMFAVVPEWKLADDGTLVNRIETDEYRAALEWTAELFASGAVHPDAVAGNTAERSNRFRAGQSLIQHNGIGDWPTALGAVLPTNPNYSQRPFEPFHADGSSDPVFWKEPAAGQRSFIKKSDDPARIEEILALADVMAAPIGTLEYELINYGVRDVHFTVDENGVPTNTDLATKEITRTYETLIQPPAIYSQMQYPGHVQDFCEWMASAAGFVEEPLFYGMNITEPTQYASIGQPIQDLEADICRGRADMSDLDAALETWRAAGGDQLRAFYQDILDSQ